MITRLRPVFTTPDDDEVRHEYGLEVLSALPEDGGVDAVILAVPHKRFEELLSGGKEIARSSRAMTGETSRAMTGETSRAMTGETSRAMTGTGTGTSTRFPGSVTVNMLQRIAGLCKKGEEPILIDVKGFFEPEEARKAGLRYWRL